MEIVRQTKTQRNLLEEKLSNASKQFTLSTSGMFFEEVEEIFSSPSAKVNIDVKTENVMSVWIPKFKYSISGNVKCYSDFSSPLGMAESLDSFWDALSVIMELAGNEHSCRLLSYEIEKTRRRVNALEYVIIPQMKQKIKFITSKLDEQERSEKVIRMKIKDMITNVS